MDDEVLMPPPTPGCERESTVGAYHDGELSDAARDAFERHLATCAACATELQRVRTVSRLLETLRRPLLSVADKEELAQSAIRAAAESQEAESQARSERMRIGPSPAVRWVRWMTAVAAAVFLFSVVQLFRAQSVAPENSNPGGSGGVPAVFPSTAPGKASANPDSGRTPSGQRLPSQPDTQGRGELQ